MSQQRDETNGERVARLLLLPPSRDRGYWVASAMVNGNAVMVTCNSRDEAFDVYEREVAVLAKRIDQSTKRSKP